MSDRGTAPGSSDPDPVGGLRFLVSIDDAEIGCFAECSGPDGRVRRSSSTRRAARTRFVHKFRGRVKYPNLVLKRGVTYEDELLEWFFASKDRDERGQLTLELLGTDGKHVRTWAFAGAFPVKWSGPSLNARSTNVATETLEIAHQGW